MKDQITLTKGEKRLLIDILDFVQAQPADTFCIGHKASGQAIDAPVARCVNMKVHVEFSKNESLYVAEAYRHTYNKAFNCSPEQSEIAAVNDGKHPDYQQPEIKDRVLTYMQSRMLDLGVFDDVIKSVGLVDHMSLFKTEPHQYCNR